MPTALNTGGYCPAISTARRLVGAVVPIVMIRTTSASAARARTSSRSGSKASSSRWACVSMSCICFGETGLHWTILHCSQCVQMGDAHQVVDGYPFVHGVGAAAGGAVGDGG